MAENREPIVQIGKTPDGIIAVETPHAILPAFTWHWGDTINWLGDPESRYGRLVSTGDVSISIKLQMLNDPIIAFTMAYVASKLVKAEYEMRCADEQIRRFFEVMYARFHREFMLQASMAVAIGYCGLIKKLRFEVPQPEDPNEPPVWDAAATPFIITGFEQVELPGARPLFDDETGDFVGFTYSGGDVDRLYALWLTIGRTRAFGKYSGWGRLRSGYKSWWLGEFADDQFVIYIQKNIDRIVVVTHPSGKTQDGVSFSEIAREVADVARSGGSLSMPGEPYKFIDSATGEEKATTLRKWGIQFMGGSDKALSFIETADHLDARKALALLVPRQVHSGVKQDVFGGPTSAQVLGALAVDLIIQEAVEVDAHLNEYVFPFLVSANFGPDAPRVTKVTTGLNEADRAELFKLLEGLINRAEGIASRIDSERLAQRLGVPLLAGDAAPEQPETEEEDDVEDTPVIPLPRRRFELDLGTHYPASAAHNAVRVAIACPMCGFPESDQYMDHGGLCVCANVECGVSFDPEFDHEDIEGSEA